MKKYWIYNLLLNAVENVVLYLALFDGSKGAANLVYFIAVNGIISGFVAANSFDKGVEYQLPAWAAWAYSVNEAAQIAVLVWFGWWWCAAAYTFNFLCAVTYRFAERKKIAKPVEKTPEYSQN